MTRIKKYLFPILLLGIISSCSTSTVEEDMEEYCQCVENANNGIERKACRVLAKEMMEKYENDPESAEYIKEHARDCRGSRRQFKFRF